MDIQSSEQQNYSPSPVEGQPEPTKSNRKLITILVIALLILAAGAGAYWYFAQPSQVACTLEAKLCPDGSYVGRSGSNCEFASCPVDKTANWQTYINSAAKYSFEYPPDWNAATNQFNNKNSLFGPNASATSGSGGVEIYQYSGTVDSFITYMQNNADVRYSSAEGLTINGLEGKKVKYAGSASSGSAVLFKSDNEIFNIHIASQNSDILKNFDLLVSTFKIIASDPTASWQTYRNEEYGFEVRYPTSWYMRNGCFDELNNKIEKNNENIYIDDTKYDLYPCAADFPLPNFSIIIGGQKWDLLQKEKDMQKSKYLIETITFSGEQALKVTSSEPSPFDASYGTTIYTNHNEIPFYISYRNKDGAGTHNPLFDQILSTFKFIDSTASWQTFKSSYFTLSFKIPSGFEANDAQNYIKVAKSPYYTRDIGDDNAFFTLTRYNQTNTRASELNRYRKLLKNIKESDISVDGSSFLTLAGDDWGRFEGDSAGKVTVVFFDASWLEIIQRPANTDQTFDPIAISNQILSTFKFTP